MNGDLPLSIIADICGATKNVVGDPYITDAKDYSADLKAAFTANAGH